MSELREKTIRELFQTLSGIEKGECEYYPCHFEGQDCTFCFCPFYPCLIYETGGYLKDERVWSCQNCHFIHKKDVVEKLISIFSSYPRQILVEADWIFFNEILQELFFGVIKGNFIREAYTIYDFENDDPCYLIKLKSFEIKDVKKGKFAKLVNEKGVVIPII